MDYEVYKGFRSDLKINHRNIRLVPATPTSDINITYEISFPASVAARVHTQMGNGYISIASVYVNFQTKAIIIVLLL